MKYRELHRTINYQHPANKMVLELGKRGFSVACIQVEVNKHLNFKMTQCQVYYRLRHSGTLLKKFRNGYSDYAKNEIQKVHTQLWGKSSKKKTG